MWRRFLERGGGWVLAQCILMLAVLSLGPIAGPDGPPAVRPDVSRLVAWGLFAGGAVFGLGGVAVLGRNRTIFPRPNDHSQLVQRGVYRWVRHPLYTSLILLAAGWSLLWGSWLTAIAGLALAVFLGFKAAHEERWLIAKFPEYTAYRRRVKRLIPGVY